MEHEAGRNAGHGGEFTGPGSAEQTKIARSDSYICERSQSAKRPCKFRLSKTILGRDISKEQVQKLLATGKTDLLDGFISKRGRPFSAYLKLEDGKVGFEFPEKIARAS